MKLKETQLELIRNRMEIVKHFPGGLYEQKFADIDVAAITTQEAFEALPFTEKGELRDSYPLGIQAVPDEEIVRIHSSSGTTGLPIIIPYTKQDVDDWALMFARCYAMAGITKQDRIHITPGYGLWTAGIGFQLGCELLGAMAIPMGPGNTEKQLKMMVDLKSTVLCATSSYALLLAEAIAKKGIGDKIKLRKGVIGSERWGDKMRQRIADELGVELYDIYGLTEIYGPGIGINCQKEAPMHYWDDFVYLEIIDPKTGKVLPDGEIGEIVLTTLRKQGAPLIRYRTHDLSRIVENDVHKVCDLAHRFETKLIRGFSFYQPKGKAPKDYLPQVVDRLGQIAEVCHRSDLTFGLEVEANLVGQNGWLLAEIFRQVNHPAMLLIFDAANLIVQGYTTAEIFEQYEAMKPGLGWIHIKDYVKSLQVKPGGHFDEDLMHGFVPSDRGYAGHEAILRDFASIAPTLTEKLKARGVPGVFLDLEPHVKGGGQFGGYSGSDGLGVALRSLCKLLDYVGIDYHLRDFDDIKAARGF